MFKFRIVSLIDKLFISVSTFLIVFAWVNFYLKNLWISFVLSLIFSFACVYLLFYFLAKKHKNLEISKQENQQIEKLFLSFRLLSFNEQLQVLKTLLNSEFLKIENEFIIFEKNGIKQAIVIATNLNVLTESDFINIVKLTQNLDISHIEILCSARENFSTKILKNKNFLILTKVEFVKKYLLLNTNFEMCKNLDCSKNKFSLNTIFAGLFLPQKSKTYFVCGIILIFSSVIIPNHFYYIIFGSMLLLFSIICKLRKFFVNKF